MLPPSGCACEDEDALDFDAVGAIDVVRITRADLHFIRTIWHRQLPDAVRDAIRFALHVNQRLAHFVWMRRIAIPGRARGIDVPAVRAAVAAIAEDGAAI